MSAIFSPISLQLLKAESSQLSLDFNTDSSLEIFNIKNDQLVSFQKKSFQTSFSCCDWSFSDKIAAGGDQGNIVISDSKSLESSTLQQVTDSDITTVRFSEEQENLIAIGTKSGEILFLDTTGKLQYTTKNKQGQNPHSYKIQSIRWNSRVPRVCCSIDESGTVIVWDTKKKGAVMTFQVKGGVDCCFSESVATVVYALTLENTVEEWDLRNKDKMVKSVQCAPGAVSLKFFEGVENILGVYNKQGIVESFECSEQMTKTGRQDLGNQFSYFYPNLFLIQYDNILQISYKCIIIKNKPILFNRKILTSQMKDDDSELIQIVRKPISLSSKNVLRNVSQKQLEQTRITDCSEIIAQIEGVLNGTDSQIDQSANEFIDLLNLDKKEIIKEMLETEKAELKNNCQNDADFFDQQNESLEKDEKAVIQEKKQITLETQKINLLLNGKINDCLQQLVEQNNYEIAFYLIIQLNITKQDATKYLEHFQKNVNIVCEKQTDCGTKLQSLIYQISNHSFSLHSCQNWRDYLKLTNSYNYSKMQQAIQETIQYLQHDNLESKNLVKLLVYSNQNQVALDETVKHITNMNLQKKLNFALQLIKYGLAYNKDEIEKIIQIVDAQGKQQLCEQLYQKLKIQQKKAAPIGVSPTQHNNVPNQQQRQLNPTQQHYDVKPVIQPQPPVMKVTAQPPSMSNNISNAPQKQQETNNFFNINQTGANIPQQMIPQQSQPQQNQPMLAVDMFGFKNQQQENLNTINPSAPPANNFFAQHDPNQFPLAPPPNNLYVPQIKPVQEQPVQPNIPPMGISSDYHSNPYNSRGSKIVAPPPPSITGQQNDNSLIQVNQTTAPRTFAKAKPIQQLFTGAKGMELINKISLKTTYSQQLFTILQQYQQKDNFGFMKNVQKLGELLLNLADYEEVQDLISAPLLQCLAQILQQFQNNQFTEAQKTVIDFTKGSGELATWAGPLKLMAIALSK